MEKKKLGVSKNPKHKEQQTLNIVLIYLGLAVLMAV